MASAQDWDTLFRNDAFIKNYKTGEKVTGQFAEALIKQSDVLSRTGLTLNKAIVVLDNACGTGVVSSILNHKLNDEVKQSWKLTCGDISEGMLEYTRRRISREAWPNTDVKQLDAQETGLPTAHFTHVFTAFAFMALPRSLAALDETCRILQPGGTVAFSTWIEPGWVRVAKEAIESFPEVLPWPTADEFLIALDNGNWNSRQWIESQLRHRGMENIKVEAVTKSISQSVPEFVEMTMIMFPMVTKYFWSEEQQVKDSGKFRPALEKYLEGTYGRDGDIPMEWTAILSTAQKPTV